jgi:hypothetical protein
MAKKPNRDPDVYAETTIAATLTVASLHGTHSAEAVIERYKEILQKLRASDGGAFN